MLFELNGIGNIGFLYSKRDGDKPRPLMHTFFHYLEDERLKRDNNLLDIWKKAWYLAGFYPVVLTIEDAQRHPLFSDFEHAGFKNAICSRCVYLSSTLRK